MVAAFGGIAFTKGLGLGNAIGHVFGAFNYVRHGCACALGPLCFVRASIKAYEKEFPDQALALGNTGNLELVFLKLYKDTDIPTRLRDISMRRKT